MRLKFPKRFSLPRWLSIISISPERLQGMRVKLTKLFSSPALARLKLPERFTLPTPVRKVVLLPDTHFFTRAVPVVAAGDTVVDVAAQVDLALEGLAPFPLPQLYHGFFWRPGAKNAFVFAAYQKRFPSEQVESWANAEAVLPTFASLLNVKLSGPSTLLLWAERSLTAVSWDDPLDAPVSVFTRELPAETPDLEVARQAMRKAMLADVGGGRVVVESNRLPELDATNDDDEFVFQGETSRSLFTREQLDVLDVRDKEELAARRRARFRDLMLWRVLVGCAVALMLTVTLEVVLIGGRIWQSVRTDRVDQQEADVNKIRLAKNLATQIEELSTNRMRPFEMISMVSEKLPSSVIFVRTTVSSIYTLEIEAQAGVSSDVDVFRSALMNMPACEKVETNRQRLVNCLSTFQLVVTFRPSAFRSTPSS